MGRWRDLLGPKHLGASTVLAGGVALYATNEFLTISLLPSAVAEIGGHRFYAWVTTVYLVASVVAATTVGAVLSRLGPRRSYLAGLTVFGAGSLLCAVAPTMELLLVGRAVQGAAGGLLAGLGYAVINAALPQSLWVRASALVSAMWGVGTLLGPAGGGLFAQFGSWRWAFGALVVLTAAMAVLVPVALPGRAATGTESSALRIPVWSLLLLGAAALVISVAGIPRNPVWTAVLLAGGLGLIAAFLIVDRLRAGQASSVLPPTAFRPGPLKWMYVTLGLLMAATMVDMYVPLFGQRLAHLEPLVAGFLGVALAVGWTTGELASASVDRRRAVVRIVAVAPLVMAIGLGSAALSVRPDASAGVTIGWALALLLTGTGIGMAWPHLSAWAMGAVQDPSAEGATAAAAINTVQLICGAFGAGVAGVIVNAQHDDGSAARWMFAVFSALAAATAVAAYRATRPTPQSGSSSS
ncbi:drug efflux membrane protein [Mycolicibacterium canariasense]|uniref:Drug efflux membrane protein n=2 Tax=Mycolicibacterium canariasense TaxID=228230 RepID=A0A100WGM5_MYCCR|nr:MFS transporter [Mycolicibacterium canariasense]MCV7213004.1 MFS transporter [Mycolicibacterium canariasense]GAS98144.1 drug efflux membrane protein [Mycolicibacterium canariasense]